MPRFNRPPIICAAALATLGFCELSVAKAFQVGTCSLEVPANWVIAGSDAHSADALMTAHIDVFGDGAAAVSIDEATPGVTPIQNVHDRKVFQLNAGSMIMFLTTSPPNVGPACHSHVEVNSSGSTQGAAIAKSLIKKSTP